MGGECRSSGYDSVRDELPNDETKIDVGGKDTSKSNWTYFRSICWRDDSITTKDKSSEEFTSQQDW